MKSSAKVLIVEDEALAALMLRRSLERIGVGQLYCESTAKGAISMAKAVDPDLILMDIGLPGDMDGIEAAEAILSFSRAKLIFITGYADPPLRARAEALGPVEYFLKPLNIERLKTAVLSSLG